MVLEQATTNVAILSSFLRRMEEVRLWWLCTGVIGCFPGRGEADLPALFYVLVQHQFLLLLLLLLLRFTFQSQAWNPGSEDTLLQHWRERAGRRTWLFDVFDVICNSAMRRIGIKRVQWWMSKHFASNVVHDKDMSWAYRVVLTILDPHLPSASATQPDRGPGPWWLCDWQVGSQIRPHRAILVACFCRFGLALVVYLAFI